MGSAAALYRSSNLRVFAAGTQSYAADNADRFWGFSWLPNVINPTQFADLRQPASDAAACANEAVDIIRRRANRPEFEQVDNWVPHVQFSYLALADYLAVQLPARWAVSPEDGPRQCWSNDPAAFEQSLGEVGPLGPRVARHA